ncbi:MAG TPA: glycoside hydrolase family 2 TIM barrel-domain containing protein [Thermoleophilaceae bacterium]|nr:glycoside hydrolase family 2 TIM barrel-domain containing protein [Thermoleophilaceae bacterium]
MRLPLPILAPLLAIALVLAPAVAADPGGPPAPRATRAQIPAPAPARPPPHLVVDRPERRTPIREGQSGRLLLAGTWYFRLDEAREGEARGFARQRSLQGWRPVSVPHNWNARDTTLNRSSHGWYRRELVLPQGARGRRILWVARFEGVSHSATVYLNGRAIARHSGAYTPFEVDLRGLRPGRNRLVVRASTMRGMTDLTHWRPARFNGFGTGGWWNFGGMSREVYLRPVRRVDVERVSVLPRMRCTRCRARVEVRTLVRNTGRRARRVSLTLRLDGHTILTGSAGVPARGRRKVLSRFTLRRPRRWRLGRGGMHRLDVTARVAGAQSAYHTAFGVRKIQRLSDGRVLLDGRAMHLHGASLHEDDPAIGAAWRAGHRRAALRRLRELGATVVRAHYPLHPAMLEALDRRGVLVWSQAPVYQVPEANFRIPRVRRNAVKANREMVLRDRNHPSIFAWSIANELPEAVGPGQASFIAAAAREVRRLDDTRLVAIDRATRAGGAEGHPAVRALDALGVNEYFGWYGSAAPGLRESTDADLGPQLDRLRAAYPRVALFVTEFGAEANRVGPEAEKGTLDFQTRWMREHLAIHDSRRFVNGSIVWALKDFRVHPTWGGGNPAPNPPWNNKGLLDESGTPKPAFWEVRRHFLAPHQSR